LETLIGVKTEPTNKRPLPPTPTPLFKREMSPFNTPPPYMPPPFPGDSLHSWFDSGKPASISSLPNDSLGDRVRGLFDVATQSSPAKQTNSSTQSSGQGSWGNIFGDDPFHFLRDGTAATPNLLNTNGGGVSNVPISNLNNLVLTGTAASPISRPPTPKASNRSNSNATDSNGSDAFLGDISSTANNFLQRLNGALNASYDSIVGTTGTWHSNPTEAAPSPALAAMNFFNSPLGRGKRKKMPNKRYNQS
jgi:hypothetical protein